MSDYDKRARLFSDYEADRENAAISAARGPVMIQTEGEITRPIQGPLLKPITAEVKPVTISALAYKYVFFCSSCGAERCNCNEPFFKELMEFPNPDYVEAL